MFFIIFSISCNWPKLITNLIIEENLKICFISEEEIPEWVSIYFVVVRDKNAMKCNLCEIEIPGDIKSPIFFDHMKETHKDIYDLHKVNKHYTYLKSLGREWFENA